MLTEDDLARTCREIALRFEALSQLEAAAERPPSVLYHYTSAEGILGILSTTQLWATNILYLNDASELSNAAAALDSVLRQTPLKTGAMTLQIFHSILPIDHFVTSFCEDGDLLSQWRAYGSQSNGYSIGFHTPALLALTNQQEDLNSAVRKKGVVPINVRGTCTLRKVRYLSSEKSEMIQGRVEILREILEPLAPQFEWGHEGAMQQLRIKFQTAASIHPTLALMKHEAFEQENEWRIVRTLWKESDPETDLVGLRIVGGRLTPYLPLPWAAPSVHGAAVKCICCGPSADPELKAKAVRDLLSWKSMMADVTLSKIPLRS